LSVHALLGLFILNSLLLSSGAAILWSVRGWTTWVEFARLAGLAYLLGVAGVGALWTLLVIAGVPFSLWIVLAVPVLVALVGGLAGRRLGRPRPEVGTLATGPKLAVTAVGIAATGLFLEAAFRSARLAGLYSWDAWSFWVPKAKAIYFFGDLDEQFFTTLPGPSYPPFVPVLDAAAFHVMGSPDVVTLHVQYWFLAVGFVWALAGLLSELVPAWILWPFVLLSLAAPRIGSRFHVPEADLLLDFLFVIAALLVGYWLLDRQPWRLVVASVLLCGVVLTKREGLLLVALLVVATLLASARQLRTTWRPLAVAVVGIAAVAVPWRVWYLIHGVGGEGPSAGLDPSENAERLWPSVRLAIEVLVDSGHWSVVAPVAIGALVLAGFARVGVHVVFFGTLIALVTLGGAWFTWAIPELEITAELGGNPIVRYMGSAVLLCIAASPVLLAAMWSLVTSGRPEEERLL